MSTPRYLQLIGEASEGHVEAAKLIRSGLLKEVLSASVLVPTVKVPDDVSKVWAYPSMVFSFQNPTQAFNPWWSKNINSRFLGWLEPLRTMVEKPLAAYLKKAAKSADLMSHVEFRDILLKPVTIRDSTSELDDTPPVVVYTLLHLGLEHSQMHYEYMSSERISLGSIDCVAPWSYNKGEKHTFRSLQLRFTILAFTDFKMYQDVLKGRVAIVHESHKHSFGILKSHYSYELPKTGAPIGVDPNSPLGLICQELPENNRKIQNAFNSSPPYELYENIGHVRIPAQTFTLAVNVNDAPVI